MTAAGTYVIRLATPDDDATLRRLAELDSARPPSGPALIGEIAAVPVAALSLHDDRLVADPFVPTAHLVATMRAHAKGLRDGGRTPSLRERLTAGVPVLARARVAPEE